MHDLHHALHVPHVDDLALVEQGARLARQRHPNVQQFLAGVEVVADLGCRVHELVDGQAGGGRHVVLLEAVAIEREAVECQADVGGEQEHRHGEQEGDRSRLRQSAKDGAAQLVLRWGSHVNASSSMATTASLCSVLASEFTNRMSAVIKVASV